MKLAIFTDLHLGIKSDDHKWHKVALEWADSMITKLKKDNISDIVFLGDFFHNRSTISVDTLNVASDWLNKFNDFTLHMILGNHDLYYDKIYDVSAVNIFNGFPNIKVYTTPTAVQFGNKVCMMCGWGYDPLHYEADVLFTHAEINVFRFNKKLGACNSDLKCSDLLGHYNTIFSGHFHLRQIKEYEKGKVRYVGNPFQMDYSDEGTPKGFDIWDTETDEIEFVENTISPTFIRYKLSDLIETRAFDKLKQQLNNSYFKLIIDRNITLQDLNDLMTLVNQCEPRSANFEWENGQSFSQNIDEEDFVIDDFELSSVMSKYVDMMEIPDKNEILGLCLHYYDKVTNK